MRAVEKPRLAFTCSAHQKQTPRGCFQPGIRFGFKLIVLAFVSRDSCVFFFFSIFFPRLSQKEKPQFSVHPLFSSSDSSPVPEFGCADIYTDTSTAQVCPDSDSDI